MWPTSTRVASNHAARNVLGFYLQTREPIRTFSRVTEMSILHTSGFASSGIQGGIFTAEEGGKGLLLRHLGNRHWLQVSAMARSSRIKNKIKYVAVFRCILLSWSSQARRRVPCIEKAAYPGKTQETTRAGRAGKERSREEKSVCTVRTHVPLLMHT